MSRAFSVQVSFVLPLLLSLHEKSLSFRYPKLFESLSVSNGSFWNPNTFNSIICISLKKASIIHMTISIAIMTNNFMITSEGSLNKVIFVVFLFQVRLIPTHFLELSNFSKFFWSFVNFNIISLSSLLFFLSSSFSLIKLSTFDFSCTYEVLVYLLKMQSFHAIFHYLILVFDLFI